MLRRSAFRLWAMAPAATPGPSGMTAGSTPVDITASQTIEACTNAEVSEPRRVPILNLKAKPTADSWNSIATHHRWGVDSSTLFGSQNESPGSFDLAGATTSQDELGTINTLAVKFWTGVLDPTELGGTFNDAPGALLGSTFGTRDKNGAVHIDYAESAATKGVAPVVLVAPHTPEHQAHKRLRIPPLPGSAETRDIFYRRALREAQYHLSSGLRNFVVDGAFGSDPATATPFRIVTDNADHAYFASISANRLRGIVSNKEFGLLRHFNAIEESAWRRPGVVIYHCPGFAFEQPRIVEEFAGPRPADMGLDGAVPKFNIIDPYSIPMRNVLAGILPAEGLLHSTAYMCGRWGFYADDRKLVSLAGDAVVSKDGKTLTVVVGDKVDLSASPFLYGSRHIRVADGRVSRAWDSVSLDAGKTTSRRTDLVEDSLGRLHRPLSPLVGASEIAKTALGGRLNSRGRTMGRFGPTGRHSYTRDAAVAAGRAGHLFGAKASPAELFRPAAFPIEATNFVIVGAAGGKLGADAAAKAVVDGMAKSGFLYAEAEPLAAALAAELGKAKGVFGAAPGADALKGLIATGEGAF